MTVYAPPGQPGSPADVQARYDNWIGGEFVAPVDGRYFENPCGVPEAAPGSLTSGDRRSDIISACRCGCCT